MKNKWSVKQLVRSVVLSRAYRASSQFHEANFMKDPENRFCWRMEPRRLEAEAIRDSMLVMGGILDTERPYGSLISQVGHAQVNNGRVIAAGPITDSPNMTSSPSGAMMMGTTSRDPQDMQRTEMARALGGGRPPRLVTIDQPASYRSVYLPIVRDNIPRSLEVFDFAESTLVISQRETSNTPDQGLFFLNNQTVIQQADTMARRLIKETNSLNQQIKSAFLWAYGRPATEAEVKLALQFHQEFESGPDSASNESGNSNLRPAERLRQMRAQVQRNRANRDRPGAGFQAPSQEPPLELEVKKLSAICQAIMASAEFRIVN
jgi:hypothetical protein